MCTESCCVVINVIIEIDQESMSGDKSLMANQSLSCDV